MEENSAVVSKKGKSKKIIIIVAVMAAVLVTGAVVGFISYSNSPTVKYNKAVTLANQYLEDMSYADAVLAFREAIALDPYNIEAYEGLAESYIGLGKVEEAIATLEEAESIIAEAFPSKDAEMLTGFYKDAAIEYYNNGDYTRAEEYAGIYIERGGNVQEIASTLVQIYLSRGRDAEDVSDYNTAEYYYNKVLEYDSNNVEALNGIDRINEKRKIAEYESALHEMAKKIITDPSKYDFSDAMILSDDYLSAVSQLSEPVFFKDEEDMYIGVYPNGFIYYGGVEDGKRKGDGFWYAGNLYDIQMTTCNWENDLPNGKGSIDYYINQETLVKQPGSIYCIHNSIETTLVDGYFNGETFVRWYMEDGGLHEWNLMFDNGYVQNDELGIAGYCTKCGASLSWNGGANMVPGLNWQGI